MSEVSEEKGINRAINDNWKAQFRAILANSVQIEIEQDYSILMDKARKMNDKPEKVYKVYYYGLYHRKAVERVAKRLEKMGKMVRIGPRYLSWTDVGNTCWCF